MQVPTILLQIIGHAVLNTVDDSVLNDVFIEATTALADEIWNIWSMQTDESERCAEITALAQVHWADFEPIATDVISQYGQNQSQDVHQVATNYLMQIPAAIRRRLRRPSDPIGRTWPAGMKLNESLDLLALLPHQIAWFTPGDRPWDIGDWELVELVGTSTLGEVWLARSPSSTEQPAALLKFCLHTAAREQLQRRNGPTLQAYLDRLIRETQHPQLLALRRAYMDATPPCLEYAYFEAGDLASLIQEWHANNQTPSPTTVTRVVSQFAEGLGHLHRLDPPVLHRDLRPTNMLVRLESDGSYACKLANAGLADLLPRPPAQDDSRHRLSQPTSGTSGWSPALALREIDPLIYASPEQLRGEPPAARDDVFSLGVLWYQMLTGNLTAGRPGGSQWRKRLLEQGMLQEQLEVLESCFEDDPAHRPANGAELAARLKEAIAARGRRPLGDGGRSGTRLSAAEPAAPRSRRRMDVMQIFDSIEEKAPELSKVLTNSIGMKLVLIPAGTFLMGADVSEQGSRANELPRHEVTLTAQFYLATTPITQEHYFRIFKTNPARFHPNNGGSPEHPVESVTWENAVEFCKKLSELPEERQLARVYRLPTEAEWEYACRAGTATPFSFGETLLATQANFDGTQPYGNAAPGRFAGKTTRVGSFPANNFGLHDMHGNVWEWCADWLDAAYYRNSAARDPKGPGAGQFRVLRGGSWRNHAVTCRSSYRNGLGPRLKDACTGFRVLLEIRTGR